ncbi:MAG: hypothetical protein HC788_12175 [Sphingopyxis sp.]|nr:hypothetical protein [Sphingopyxis sp.]
MQDRFRVAPSPATRSRQSSAMLAPAPKRGMSTAIRGPTSIRRAPGCTDPAAT